MFMGLGLTFTALIIGAIAYALGWRPQGNNNFSTSSGNTRSALFPRTGISQNSKTGSKGDALAILKQRCVQGELSKEEFETIRRDLEQP